MGGAEVLSVVYALWGRRCRSCEGVGGAPDGGQNLCRDERYVPLHPAAHPEEGREMPRQPLLSVRCSGERVRQCGAHVSATHRGGERTLLGL